ncbi:MAG TPA: hypothetical protein VEA19_06325 [Actinomycetota bacterium]|nr:hypothetical protein [Actinomycetota bacterium]
MGATIGGQVEDLVADLRRYLATPEGRRMRKRLAGGLMVAAPVLTRLPMFKRTLLGRLLAGAAGTALLVKAAQWIRDWEPGETDLARG